MNRVILKIAFFALAIIAVGALNAWAINGPLLQHNTAVGMNQFGGTPAPAGDFEIAGYWLTFNTVYIVEVVVLALLGALLFVGHILNALFPDRNAPKEDEVYVLTKKKVGR